MVNSRIAKMASTMKKEGCVFEPISVVKVDNMLVIDDGHHRAQAAIKAKLSSVPVKISKPMSAEHADKLRSQAYEAIADKASRTRGVAAPAVPQSEKGESDDSAPTGSNK